MSAPCQPWVTADEIAECCSGFPDGTDTSALEAWAEIATNVLSTLSGGAYLGECGPIIVRPCADDCGCWSIVANRGVMGWQWDSGSGRWNCGGRSCGCSPVSEVWLDGYPREIVEVKIDGAVVPDDEYRLDTLGRLVRMRDPAEPRRRRLWPSCQIIDLEDSEEGTFSIEYTFGLDPPPEAIAAATALACQLWLACNNSGRCKLPERTRTVARAGLTIEIGTLIADSLAAGATGILAIDEFIAAHKNIGVESTVWSPDIPAYPRRMLDQGT